MTRPVSSAPESDNATDPLYLAGALIRCKSVTPADNGALELLAGVLERLGFACRRLRFGEPGFAPVDNLFARLEAAGGDGCGGPDLCFAGHTDVVPPGDAADWQDDPFAASVRDGMLYGRGAADMKGAIACFVAAVAQLLAEEWQPAGSVSLLITGDEEGVAVNGTRKMLPALTETGVRFDACITGEPTNPEKLGTMMKIGRRGSLNGHIIVHGTQGHTGYVHLADNAAHRLVSMLHALTNLELDRGSEHFQPSTLAISSIDIGNTAENVIPGRAEARFNVRFNDLHSGDSLTGLLRDCLEQAAGDGARFDFTVRVSGESFLTPPGRLSTLIADAAQEVTGRRPQASTTGGTSDSRFIKDYCPVVDFGLVGDSMHKVDEYAALSDLNDLTEIYRRVLLAYFEGG